MTDSIDFDIFSAVEDRECQCDADREEVCRFHLMMR